MKTTWPKAIAWFIAPLLIAMTLRWALFEPYVIPSGSMIPTLLVHDHILVNKWAYGLRLPFSENWLVRWKNPQKGEIVVFKYPVDKETFFVKRIVATGGDVIEVKRGTLIINNQVIDRVESAPVPTVEDFEDFNYYLENLNSKSFISRSSKDLSSDEFGPETVPAGHFFVVGDNRDQSSDSRVWGFVPEENLMGKASLIWLSCENTLPAAPLICDPKVIRWTRIFKGI